MIVVKVELHPHGDPGRAKVLSEIHISNDETGTDAVGNYDVEFIEPGRRRILKGHVEGHTRADGVFDLIRQALAVPTHPENT